MKSNKPQSAQDIWDAGLAIMIYNINSNSQNWRYYDETFKTRYIQTERLEVPRVVVARIEAVLEAAI